MSPDRILSANDLPRDVSDTRAAGWWGMLLGILSQAAILVSIVVAYAYLGSGENPWPPEEIGQPALLWATVGTVVLLASAAPMAWAIQGIQGNDQGRLKLGLAASFVLGLAFLGIAYYEYIRQEFDLKTTAYASSFLTLLAFQGVQVGAALVMSALVQLWAWLGYYDERRHLAVRNLALEWYYIVASWIVVFVVLYVSPHMFD